MKKTTALVTTTAIALACATIASANTLLLLSESSTIHAAVDDGTPDKCTRLFTDSSGPLESAGVVMPMSFTIDAAPDSSSDVTFNIVAFGDFETPDKFMHIALNGEPVSSALVYGQWCESFTETVVIPRELYTTLVDGSADFDLTFTQWVAPMCGLTRIEVEVNYFEDIVGAACSPADLNGDGSVGPADLAHLLGAWGECADLRDCPEDLDINGQVGVADLALLLGSWG